MALGSKAVTSSAVSVLITSTTIATNNISRREITVVNDHASQIVYLALNTTDSVTVPTAVANSGVRLNAAGGSWTSNRYKGPVAGISVGGTSVCTVAEV